MTAEADVSLSRARFGDVSPEGNHIPGALNRVVSGAVTVEPARQFFGIIRLRHFGPRPLIEDATVRSKSTTIWNGEVGYRATHRTRLMFEAFNLFDADVSDIDYFYRSRLPGEPLAGMDDIHLHPALPRSARVTLQFDPNRKTDEIDIVLGAKFQALASTTSVNQALAAVGNPRLPAGTCDANAD
jgi:hypothetical protein